MRATLYDQILIVWQEVVVCYVRISFYISNDATGERNTRLLDDLSEVERNTRLLDDLSQVEKLN